MSSQPHRSRPRAQPSPLIRVVHVDPPQIVRIDAADFRSTVQSLTGWTNPLSDTSAHSPSTVQSLMGWTNPLLDTSAHSPSSSSTSSSSSSSSCCSSPAANHPNSHSHLLNYITDSSTNYLTNQAQLLAYRNQNYADHHALIVANSSAPPSPSVLQACPYSTITSSAMASAQLIHTQTSSSSSSPSASCSFVPASPTADAAEDNDNKSDEELYLCMMMELDDIQDSDTAVVRQPLIIPLTDDEIVMDTSNNHCLNFFDHSTSDDDDDLLHIRLLANLRS